LLNASYFGFSARHSAKLQRMRLTDHMSRAAVFLDIEKAFEIIWHRGLVYKLTKLNTIFRQYDRAY